MYKCTGSSVQKCSAGTYSGLISLFKIKPSRNSYLEYFFLRAWKLAHVKRHNIARRPAFLFKSNSLNTVLRTRETKSPFYLPYADFESSPILFGLVLLSSLSETGCFLFSELQKNKLRLKFGGQPISSLFFCFLINFLKNQLLQAAVPLICSLTLFKCSNEVGIKKCQQQSLEPAWCSHMFQRSGKSKRTVNSELLFKKKKKKTKLKKKPTTW